MLIEDFLPTYDVREHHTIEVAAPPDRVYRAVYEVDFTRSTVTRFLFAIRGLPWRGPIGVRHLADLGFALLAEEPGIEVVYGVIGRFWRPRGGLRAVTADEFVTFAEPGYAKAAWNFRVDSASGSTTTVATETRVITTDSASRSSFTRYWRLIGPFSALTRRRLLTLIRDEAERR